MVTRYRPLTTIYATDSGGYISYMDYKKLQAKLKEKDELIFAYDSVRSPVIDKTIIDLHVENDRMKKLINSYGKNDFDFGVLGEIDRLQTELKKLLECRVILRQALSNISKKSIIANTEDKMVSVASKALSRSIDNSGF